MSNIYQHNFHNCRLRLSNSYYWDHFISYDCKGSGLNHGDILSGDCLYIDIDLNDNNTYGNAPYSNVYGSQYGNNYYGVIYCRLFVSQLIPALHMSIFLTSLLVFVSAVFPFTVPSFDNIPECTAK